jgi:transcriptional regulator with XRE-family HTH domain
MMRLFNDQTQSELAKHLGISKSYLSEIESGKKTPGLDLIAKYSEIYEIPSSQILQFSEMMHNKTTGEKVRVFTAKKVLSFLSWVADDDQKDSPVSK